MSRPFKIEVVESEEELRKRIQTANLGNQKEKRYYAVVDKKWTG
ncbi:MAG: hypothetical protein PUP92_19475 [Rhizonema sp. PD38]|nr:hypothetical protein [Rhizonema sp. PD38]